MSIKIFCDICGEQITESASQSCGVVQISSLKTTIDQTTRAMVKVPSADKYELCQTCLEEYEKIFNTLKEKYGKE